MLLTNTLQHIVMSMYEYEAKVFRVDPDKVVWLYVDLGFRQWLLISALFSDEDLKVNEQLKLRFNQGEIVNPRSHRYDKHQYRVEILERK